jgi:prepilin-type N-terminal cleavage/methylation domain-containing protein
MRKAGFTMIEIMIVVCLIGMLVAIAVPYYSKARDQSQRQACLNNLTQISGAKDRYALENGKVNGDTVTQDEIDPYFLKKWEECPAGGVYTINAIGTDPECNIPSHSI